MGADRFGEWCRLASTAERCEAAVELSKVVAAGPSDERAHAERLLARFAVDPSPKVRAAISEALATSAFAPAALVRVLLCDIDRIAVPLAASSPVPGVADLIDLAAVGSPALRTALARRRTVCARLAAKLAEVGEPQVLRELLLNPGADKPFSVLLRIADKAVLEPRLGELMLSLSDLPASLRDRLARAVASRLAASPLVCGILGASASRIAAEASENATMAIAARMPAREIAPFTAHLRDSSRLSTAFLANAACRGELDLFAAALAELSGLPYVRVRRIIVDARVAAFQALLRAARIPRTADRLLICAVRTWKQVVTEGIDPRETGVADRVMEHVAACLAVADGSGDEDASQAILARTMSLSAKRTVERCRADLREAA